METPHGQRPPGRAWLALLGILVALFGLVLAIGGVRLVTLGGSWYFVLMGIASLVAGVLIFRRRPLGALIYAAAFVATVIWALADAGLTFWPQVSRLVLPAILAMLVAFAWPALRRNAGRDAGIGGPVGGGVLLVALLATLIGAFQPRPIIAGGHDQALVPVTKDTEQKNWAAWANTDQGTRFAALDQINRGNVSQLQVAWTAHTGDVPQSTGAGAEDQNTPLQIGDTLYV